eukprot:Trichotokara_eunicae@DN2328_c0_g2_i2.p1
MNGGLLYVKILMLLVLLSAPVWAYASVACFAILHNAGFFDGLIETFNPTMGELRGLEDDLQLLEDRSFIIVQRGDQGGNRVADEDAFPEHVKAFYQLV